MSLLERARSRLRSWSILLGDWWAGVWFTLRYRLPVEAFFRVRSVLPDIRELSHRARGSRAAKLAGSAADAVGSSASSGLARVGAVVPEPVKKKYREATKTEDARAAAVRTSMLFLASALSLAAFILGAAFVHDVWMATLSFAVIAFSSIALFTQESEEKVTMRASTVEHVVGVFSLGEGLESIVVVHTTSIGGEPRSYTIMREDLAIIDSPQSWAYVTRTAVRRVSRNAFGWVMSVEDSEYVKIDAYTALTEERE